MPPRILTFNFHEPYLCLMAKTGYEFAVGIYDTPPLGRTWQHRFRPLPKNLTLVEPRIWRSDLEAGRYDVVIAQNETNAADIFKATLVSRTPMLMVCHNRRRFLETTLQGDKQTQLRDYGKLLQQLIAYATFIFISESKRDDYKLPGRVILPGLDVAEYGGYEGPIAEVLRVGNVMRSRNLMFDVDFQERVCAGIPNRVVGDDPGIPAARPSASFDDLLTQYRSLRCLLHVTREEYEDGYNLSMLEAMACGMPVVSLANRTSPLTDGTDGFVSDNPDVLRGRLGDLLADRDLARALGERGRETVQKKFPIATFVEKWSAVIEESARHSSRSTNAPRAAEKAPSLPRMKVLMDYVASPITTARYMERALRKQHDVLTAGYRIPEAVLQEWGFDTSTISYPPHDIDFSFSNLTSGILARLPKSFVSDLYLWVDSGVKEAPADIGQIQAARICYLIDTHIAPDIRLEIARHFDFTFLAQRAQVADFTRAGIPNVFWLPLACSPELHAVGPFERVYDVAYVGGLQDAATDRRTRLLRSVAERFPNSFVGRAWPDEMARIYAQSKIVVNACVNRDVNMRVFEAMAAGALLITDEADGLSDLFKEGTHYVLYRHDDEVLDLVARYLADSEARERIAAAGAKHVRRFHTYDIRVESMVTTVLEALGAFGGVTGESRFRSGGYYCSARPELAAHVPRNARRVLDCGCGGGQFGRFLKAQGVKEVVGIEIVERAWEMAKRQLDDALLGDIEKMDLPFADGYFDCICFGDVLEHLVNPTDVLRKVARLLAPDGVIVMSIPNVQHHSVVEMLVNSRWEYVSAGILDRTHLRFFTAVDAYRMVSEAGLETLKVQPLSMTPPNGLKREPDGTLRIKGAILGPLTDAQYQEFLTYQYLVVAGKPNRDHLAGARRALDESDNELAYELAQQAQGAGGVDEFERKRIMAKAVARLGKFDLALKLYIEALELDPKEGVVAGEFGITLLAANRPEDAEPYLKQALDADPDNDRALGALGLVRLTQGLLPEAFDLIRAALERQFDNESLMSHLIEIARALDRNAEIEALVRRYVDFRPGNAAMLVRHAALLGALDRKQEGIDRVESLLLLMPDHEPAQRLLAELRGAS